MALRAWSLVPLPRGAWSARWCGSLRSRSASLRPPGPAWLHSSAVQRSLEIAMPSLSPTMTEGTIVKWNKAEGEAVVAGDVLCEIQTDKAVVALEADDDGTLARIVASSDSGSMAVGQLIAIIAEEGEDWQTVAQSVGSASSGQPPAETSQTTREPTGGSTTGTPVKMPSLSPTMTEGTIEGDKINPGDVLCEIQTDKAVVAVECDDEAVLAKILVPEGQSGIEVGYLIAMLVEEGEDWQDVQIPAQESSSTSTVTSSEPSASSSATPPSSGTSGSHHFEHIANVGPATHFLMAQYGVKASQVNPTGPKGIVKADVLQYIKDNHLKPIEVQSERRSGAQSQPPPASPAALPADKKPSSGFTDIPLTSMRTVIAKRLTESKQTSPHGHATVATNIESILQLRKELAARGIKVSVNDFIIKAAGTALQYVPEMNLNVKGEDFQIMSNVDISVAVATDAGLITPIVKDVPNKSLDQISKDVKDLATRARDGKLQLNEFQGGTFTISNLGMFGITEFTAIINPPQVGILAVGSGLPEIDASTGQTCTMMRSTLSFDRRFIDEALAADFMSTFQTVLERPEFMNLGLLPVARRDRLALTLP
eukprot:maker-scaffold755_size101758-snap-gene-0.25 protein:Tk12409 transcript:maker-scaffold755_size101758-snap-gene-0.25-mRNA-1 annotation:"pyruvate dehydrogenase protein x mitochondrial-like"